MTSKHKRNLPASIRQRLLNLSKERGEDFNLVLTWYAVERLLYRLSQSEYADQFILKGAMLFTVWTRYSYRPTKDLDLLGFGDSSPEQLTHLFRQVCSMDVVPDGLTFDAESIQIAEIREDQEYQGKRIQVMARMENARIDMQIDVGFGDVVTPSPKKIEYPTLLELPAPRIRAYPQETFIAEKLQALVALGMANSRMKDFYDLWQMASQFAFDGPNLAQAIGATFERRKTRIPTEMPAALCDEFASDPDKAKQWKAFLHKSKLEGTNISLGQVVTDLRKFLIPPMSALIGDGKFVQSWKKGSWE